MIGLRRRASESDTCFFMHFKRCSQSLEGQRNPSKLFPIQTGEQIECLNSIKRVFDPASSTHLPKVLSYNGTHASTTSTEVMRLSSSLRACKSIFQDDERSTELYQACKPNISLSREPSKPLIQGTYTFFLISPSRTSSESPSSPSRLRSRLRMNFQRLQSSVLDWAFISVSVCYQSPI